MRQSFTDLEREAGVEIRVVVVVVVDFGHDELE